MKANKSRIVDYIALVVFFWIASNYIYFFVTSFLFAGDDDLLAISSLMVVFGFPVFLISVYGSVKIVQKIRPGKK